MNKRTMIKTGQRMEKCFHFTGEVKQEERNGVTVGIIEGYGSTWDLDRGDDVILPGAFAKTIQEKREQGRPIRMLFGHDYDNLIGGFPIEHVMEDDKGLFVRGEINLEFEEGRKAYALAKQGVLSDMSIGFSIPSMDAIEFEEDGDRIIRKINEIDLWELSLVPEPMNPHANITAVKNDKGAVPFQDLPLGSREARWDSDEAISRVRQFTGSTESPSGTYRDAFLWYDESEPDNFGSYKLPIADVVDGELRAMPRAIFAAAAALSGARGGVDLPASDRDAVVNNVERYYEKLDLPSPFQEGRGIDITFAEACQSIADVEELLKFAGFSSASRKFLISVIKDSKARDGELELDDPDRDGKDQLDNDELSELGGKLKSFNEDFAKSTLINKLKV